MHKNIDLTLLNIGAQHSGLCHKRLTNISMNETNNLLLMKHSTKSVSLLVLQLNCLISMICLQQHANFNNRDVFVILEYCFLTIELDC